MAASLLLVVAGTASSAEIDVMTQNQYFGTDLTPVSTAPPDQVSARVVEALAYSCADLPGTPASEGCGNQRIAGAFVDFLAAT